MKTILFLLIVFTSFQVVHSEPKHSVFSNLQKGDWFDFELSGYPYSKPISNTFDRWSAENIMKITLQGRVTKRTNKEAHLNIYLKHIYYNYHQNAPSGGFQNYYDSYYSTDTFDGNTPIQKYVIHLDGNKNETRVYAQYGDSTLSFPTQMIPLGVKNTTGFTSAKGSIEFNYFQWIGEKLDKTLQNNFQGDYNSFTDASFPLPPNVRIVYFPRKALPETDDNFSIGDQNIKIQRQGDGSYSMECFIASPRQAWLANSFNLRLTPGDTILIRETDDKRLTFEGKNAATYNFWQEVDKNYDFFVLDYRIYFKLLSPEIIEEKISTGKKIYTNLLQKYGVQIHPYWKKSAMLSIEYWEMNYRLREYLLFLSSQYRFFDTTKTDTPPHTAQGYKILWEQSPFSTVTPFTDYLYQPEFYANFLEVFFHYKAQQLNADNLTNKFYWAPDADTYYLQKQLFSGYPRIKLLSENLEAMMQNSNLSDSKREYEDFRALCKNPVLLEKIEKQWSQYAKLEPGSNIRDAGLIITDSLPLRKKANGYILLSESFVFGDPQDFSTNARIEQILKEFKIEDKTTLCFFRPESRRQYLPDSLKNKSPFRFINDSIINNDKTKMNLSPWTMILMKNDGTIISRDIEKTSTGVNKLQSVLQEYFQEKETHKTFSRAEVYAFLICLLAIFTLVAFFVLLRFRRIKLSRKLTELELKAIRSQMNPHFIFNALGSIQSLIIQEKNDSANHYLTDFSKLLRNVLSSSEKKLVPLSDEIGLLRLYLQLEQMRTPFEFTITTDCSVNADNEEIPGMLLQPIVENAVIHGIIPQGGGLIEIYFYQKKSILYCQITDNGPGLGDRKSNTLPSKHFGLRATEERLHLLNKEYHSEIGIVLKNRQDEEKVNGCRVIISIPV